MPALKKFIAARSKAIAGVLAVGLVWLAHRFGLPISQDQALLITAVVVGLIVHQAPANA